MKSTSDEYGAKERRERIGRIEEMWDEVIVPLCKSNKTPQWWELTDDGKRQLEEVLLMLKINEELCGISAMVRNKK